MTYLPKLRVLLRPALSLKTERFTILRLVDKKLTPVILGGNFSPILPFDDLLEYAKRVALQGNSNKFVAYSPEGYLEGVYIASQLGGSRVKVERIRWHLCSSFATKADNKTPLHRGVWTNVDTIYIDFPDVSGPIAPFIGRKGTRQPESERASRSSLSGDVHESEEGWRDSVPGDWVHPAFRE